MLQVTATTNTTTRPTTTTTTTLTPPTAYSNPSTAHHVTKPSQHAFSTSTTRSWPPPRVFDPPGMCSTSQPLVSTTRHPRSPKRVYNCSYTRFSFFFTRLDRLQPHIDLFKPHPLVLTTHDPLTTRFRPHHAFPNLTPRSRAPTTRSEAPTIFFAPSGHAYGCLRGFFLFFSLFFLSLYPGNTRMRVSGGFFLFFAPPGHVDVFPGLVFHFLYFIFWCFFFVYFLSLHPRDTHTRVSVVYLFYFYLCTLGHASHACFWGFFLFYFLFFFAPQQPVSTSRHVFRPPTTPTHTFWPHTTPRPRVHWHPRPQNAHTSNRMCVSDVFIYFILFYSIWDACTTARTRVSHILFIENVWITMKVLAGTFK